MQVREEVPALELTDASVCLHFVQRRVAGDERSGYTDCPYFSSMEFDLLAHQFQIDRWFGESFRGAHPGVVQRAVDTFLRNDVDAYAASCAMLGACDLRAALPNIKAPTRVVVGEEDYATPVAMAEALTNGIAGGRLTVIRGARHFTPLERPDVIAEELRRLTGQAAAR